MTVLKNSKSQLFYGLHMSEGVAEYPEHKDQNGKPTRILVLENALKVMDRTFQGCPVYVYHVDEVPESLDAQKREADGVVVRSFFNSVDGKHWVEFMVTSERGLEAVRKGWKLSNAYAIKNTRGGGKWHAVDYQQEVIEGAYNHLAIVPDPRYEESMVLTPEQFKEYNSKKEQELRTLINSKEKRSMLKFWKKSEIENAAEIEGVSVTLKNGKTVTIAQLINEAEAKEEKKEEPKAEEKKNEEPMVEKKEEKKNEGEGDSEEPVMANGDHMVKVGESTMTVNELVEKHLALTAPKNEEKEEPKKEEPKNEEPKKEEPKVEEKKANSHFDALKNAHLKNGESETIETSEDQLTRGKQRYGSV